MRRLGLVLLLLVLAVGLADKVRICYYTNWAQYRQGTVARFAADHIDPFLCTHIAFAFARVDPNTDSMVATEWNDWQKYADIVSLKSQNPNLKVLLAVGGYSHGTVPFNNVASNAVRTAIFANNTIRMLRDAGFDGLDVDWEWPNELTRSLFISFIQRLRIAFDQEVRPPGKERLILTAAVNADVNSVSFYGPTAIAQYVDYVMVMAYDLFGTWSLQLAHHSPLYIRPQDANNPTLGAHSMHKSVLAWLNAGIPKEKLVLGFASYGRGVRLNSALFHNIGDYYSRQLSSAGPYTGIAGVLSYYEICQKLAAGWNRVYVPESEVPYAYSNFTLDWTCYDDPHSFKAKAEYVVDQDLAGAMVWSLDFDDFSSLGCNAGKYPLISQIKNVFEAAQLTPTATMPPSPSPTTTPPMIPTETTTPPTSPMTTTAPPTLPTTTTTLAMSPSTTTATSPTSRTTTTVPITSPTTTTISTTLPKTTTTPATSPTTTITPATSPTSITTTRRTSFTTSKVPTSPTTTTSTITTQNQCQLPRQKPQEQHWRHWQRRQIVQIYGPRPQSSVIQGHMTTQSRATSSHCAVSLAWK